MKVLCVDGAKGKNKNFKGPIPVLGEIYTVVGDCHHFPNSYVLAEFGEGYSYIKRRFIPVSDIDEKEFERNYNKEPQTA